MRLTLSSPYSLCEGFVSKVSDVRRAPLSLCGFESFHTGTARAVPLHCGAARNRRDTHYLMPGRLLCRLLTILRGIRCSHLHLPRPYPQWIRISNSIHLRLPPLVSLLLHRRLAHPIRHRRIEILPFNPRELQAPTNPSNLHRKPPLSRHSRAKHPQCIYQRHSLSVHVRKIPNNRPTKEYRLFVSRLPGCSACSFTCC